MTAIEVTVIVAVLWIATVPLDMVGAVAAAAALLAGRTASPLWLARRDEVSGSVAGS